MSGPFRRDEDDPFEPQAAVQNEFTGDRVDEPLETMADAGYETITVSAGGHETININQRFNGTMENVLIDCRAAGASASIIAHGTNQTIRNVGFLGELTNPQDVAIGISDRSGGTTTVENVYLGDGASRGHRDGIGMWVAPQHNGHIDVSYVNVQEMGDNAFYCSAPTNGSVDLYRCFAANCWVAQFRLSKGEVRECACLIDGSRAAGRGVWAWGPGPVEIIDCELETRGEHHSVVSGHNTRPPVTVTMTGTQYDTGFNRGNGLKEVGPSSIDRGSGNGTSPNAKVPEGCPRDAKMAASGESESPAEPPDEPAEEPERHVRPLDPVDPDPYEHTLVLRSIGMEDSDGEVRRHHEFDWDFWIDGDELVHCADYDTSYLGADLIVGDVDDDLDLLAVTGVTGGEDGGSYRYAFRFDGEIAAFSNEPVSDEDEYFQYELDGEVINPDNYPDEPDDYEPLPEHILTITGEDTFPPETEYIVQTSDELIRSDAYNSIVDDEESEIRSPSETDGDYYEATGVVRDWRHAYRFDGEIVGAANESGDAEWYLDSKTIDPDDYGDPEDPDDGDDEEDEPKTGDPPDDQLRNGSLWVSTRYLDKTVENLDEAQNAGD